VAGVLVAAAVVPAALLAVLFPEGGDFPFVADAFWPPLAATLAVLVALPREERVLRAGVALYALVLVASYVVATPMGGNAVRLGALLGGPVAALALWPHRRRRLLALAPFLLYWQLQTPIDDWVRSSGDPSVKASYYDGLVRYLAARPGPVRVEIPFTDNHWESAHVAGGRGRIPLARGWERQLDREVNPLFYDGAPLTAARYRRWLDDTGVSYVALHDAPMDYSAADEAALIRAGTPDLREVWRDEHWRVFAVRGARGQADGGRVTAIEPGAVELEGGRDVLLRVRWTPYWQLTRGRGCVSKAGDWTRLHLDRPGRARIEARFAPGRVGSDEPRCTPSR
jgi:hypothetical protein